MDVGCIYLNFLHCVFSDAYSHWLHLIDRGTPLSKQFEAAVTSGGSFCPRESCCWVAGRRPQSSLGPHRSISCLQLFHFSNWMKKSVKRRYSRKYSNICSYIQILKMTLNWQKCDAPNWPHSRARQIVTILTEQQQPFSIIFVA